MTRARIAAGYRCARRAVVRWAPRVFLAMARAPAFLVWALLLLFDMFGPVIGLALVVVGVGKLHSVGLALVVAGLGVLALSFYPNRPNRRA